MSCKEDQLNGKDFDHTRKVIKGAEKPKFFSEIMDNGSHSGNESCLRGEVQSKASELKNTLNRKKVAEWMNKVPPQTVEFGAAYARYRDYRIRYGTGYWLRKRGWDSKKRGLFIRGTLYEFGKGEE